VEQEQAVVHVDIAYRGACLVVGTHVGKLVVLAESLAAARGADAAGDIEFLGHDVVPDTPDGLDIVGIAGEGGHVGHARVHVCRPHGMAHGLVLLDDGQVALRVFLLDGGLATIVEEELSLVEILLVARGEIEFAQGHLGNLVPGHHACLPRLGSYLTHHAVGIAYGDVQELAAAGGLPVCHGTLNHVSEVVQLMAQVFFLAPSLVARPVMRVLGVLCTCGVEIAVGFLRLTDDVEHRVDIVLHLLVGVGLQDIARALDGLVRVGVVERQRHEFRHVVALARMSGALKVLVSALALAFAESQGNGHFA